MTPRRVGVYGVHEESLRVARLLAENPEIEVVRYYDDDLAGARSRASSGDGTFAAVLTDRLVDDVDAFLAGLDVVIDDGRLEPILRRRPEASRRGGQPVGGAGRSQAGSSSRDPDRDAAQGSQAGPLQIVTPLTARLLWGYGEAAHDRKGELLHALTEVVESVDLTIDADELFARMLEIAVAVTGADGGSLMLLDEGSRTLAMQVGIGIERELWPKIRVPLGEGISGVAASRASTLHLRGKADQSQYHLQRERHDVESALCVPLVQNARVLGVLNLHHSTQLDAFSDADVAFVEQLAALDAQIIHRAQEHEALRKQAARFEIVQEVAAVLDGNAPLPTALRALCTRLAERLGDAIVSVLLHEGDRDPAELELAATSLAGGGFGDPHRIRPGQGVDGRVARTRMPAFLHSTEGDFTYAALPLCADDTLLGVLTAQLAGPIVDVRAANERLLEIAEAVSDGIARTRRETRMQQQATRVTAINETGIRMLSAGSVEEVVRIATASISLILDAGHAILRMQDPDSKRYCIASYFGPGDTALQTKLFGLDKRTAVLAIKRRTAFLERDLAAHPDTAPFADEFTSLLAAPLKREGQVIGTLAIYDRVAADRFLSGCFDDDDMQTFARFASYVERALEHNQMNNPVGLDGNTDAESGLPNARYLGTRIHEELVRAAGREDALCLAICSIDNWDDITRSADPTSAARVARATQEALRSVLRDFDVVSRLGSGDFGVLLPDPGDDPVSRVQEIARALGDRISRDDGLNDPVRVVLSFGYARYPSEGEDTETLLEVAAAPRIRMVS